MEQCAGIKSDEEDSQSKSGEPRVDEIDRQESPHTPPHSPPHSCIESNSELLLNNTEHKLMEGKNYHSEERCLEKSEASLQQKQNSGTVVSPSSSTGEFNVQRGLSRRDSIRLKLREKEQNLNAMMEKQSMAFKNSKMQLEKSASIEAAVDESTLNESTLNETKSDSTENSSTSLSTTKNNVFFRMDGKEDADRREAVRVLSQTLLQLQKKLKEEKNDANRFQKEVKILISSLQRQQEQRVEIDKELIKVRNENICNSRLIIGIENDLKKKANKIEDLQQQNQSYQQKEQKIQDDVTLWTQEGSRLIIGIENDLKKKANKIEDLQQQNQFYQQKEQKIQDDFTLWTQKDSLSKIEQIEHLEYQIFAKNNEIDDLKQELNRMLRKIVGLEVDLETHEDRFHSNMDTYCSTMVQQQQEYVGEDEITRSTVDDSFCTMKDATCHFENISRLSSPDDKSSRRGFDGLRRIISFRKKGRTNNKSFFPESPTNTSISKYDESNCGIISRLQTDLNNLEARYKKDKSRSRADMEQLKQENHEYLIKILTLEKSLRGMKSSSAEESDDLIQTSTMNEQQQLSQSGNAFRYEPTGHEPKDNPGSTYEMTESCLTTKEMYLEKTIETLKNTRLLQSSAIESLHTKIENHEKEADKQLSHGEDVTKQYNIELETRDLKIAALERELAEITATTGNNVDQQEHIAKKGIHMNAAIGLEVKLKEVTAEVVRLRKIQEVKDKQIETLRTETKERRLPRMQPDDADGASIQTSSTCR